MGYRQGRESSWLEAGAWGRLGGGVNQVLGPAGVFLGRPEGFMPEGQGEVGGGVEDGAEDIHR